MAMPFVRTTGPFRGRLKRWDNFSYVRKNDQRLTIVDELEFAMQSDYLLGR